MASIGSQAVSLSSAASMTRSPEGSERYQREREMDNVRYCFHVFSFGCVNEPFVPKGRGKP
jgi:hypothetical protein